MGGKAGGTVNGNGEEGEWGQENDVKTQTTVGRWLERNQRGSVGSGGGREDNGWGYGQAPNECRKDIDKRGIGSGNAPDGGKSDRSGGSTESGRERDLRVTSSPPRLYLLKDTFFVGY